MIYCFGTDVLIEYFRGSNALKKRIETLREEDSVGFTWLTIYEFFKGIFLSGKLQEEAFLKGLAKTCTFLETSYEAARIGGEIYPVRNNAPLLCSGDANYSFFSELGVESPV